MPKFRDDLSVPSRANKSTWIYWPLKMGPISCSKTSTRDYHYAVRNTPEERRSHLLRGESRLISRWVLFHTLHFLEQTTTVWL